MGECYYVFERCEVVSLKLCVLVYVYVFLDFFLVNCIDVINFIVIGLFVLGGFLNVWGCGVV